MKRSEIIDIIDEVLYKHKMPLLSGISKEILGRLEIIGFRLTEVVDYGYDGSELQIQPYEPEEGWDEYFKKQDEADRARDFKVIPKLNIYSGEPTTSRSMEISQKFLDGKSFEELAEEYNVTIERVRQCVARQRRRYTRSLDGKDENG